MIATRERVAREHAGDWSRLERIREAAFAATLAAIGSPENTTAADLNQLYLRRRFTGTGLYPDVLPCLERLDPGYTMGLISNGNGYPTSRGLEPFLAFTVFAEDHGVAKPEPDLFLEAARLAGCRPTEIVHVGDGSSDIHGGKRAGCRAILIDRGSTRPAHANDADAVIHDLRALPDLVSAWT